jgi:protein SCO1/2
MKLSRFDILKIATVLLVFIAGLTASYYILKPKRVLPVYNPSQLDKRLVDESIQGKGTGHRTMPFALLNQYGDSVTEMDVAGKIVVADFFFTTCPSICKDMAIQKRRLQQAFKDDNELILLSHTVTPEIDSVPVMREYGDVQGAIKGKWHLLTGDKPQIYKLARESYFSVLDEGGNGDENDFIHTENFVLVDTRKRIRGFYDGTSEKEVNQLMEDIRILEKETQN